MSTKPHSYIVYIDEAGDPGIKQKPAETLLKASEWFVLSALVVSSSRDCDVPVWAADIRDALGKPNLQALHFHSLSAGNQRRCARMLARKDARFFTVASHKTNMRGYQNQRIGGSFGRGSFYNWCLRLLLERITDWCWRRSMKAGKGVEPVKVIFSERGGHDYDHLSSYIDLLDMQARHGTTFLDRRTVVPDTLSSKNCVVLPHHQCAGAQLADIIASAMMQGADSSRPKYSLEPALELMPRTALFPGMRHHAEYGLMRLPFKHQAEIPKADRPLFEAYGYSWK